MDNTDHSEQNNFSPLTVQEVDVDFLPIVYEIIRRYINNLFLDIFSKIFKYIICFSYYVVLNETSTIIPLKYENPRIAV